MNTQIFTITDPVRDAEAVARAGAILREGGLVAFPTETVYGLGGNALDATAAARIFAAKGRPQDNPLIVHIAEIEQLDALVHDIPNAARRLADAYWPGPLTMILPKNACIPIETTGGLDTCGIRMPSHPVARALISAAGVPVAAPSANLSGKPSTTNFSHVYRDMNTRVDAIIDGGESEVGLESTVIEFDGERARILRPGFITQEDIEAVLGEGMCEIAHGVREHISDGERVRSPGMKYRHYAPQSPVYAICGDPADVAREMRRRIRGQKNCAAIICDEYAKTLPCRTIACGPAGDYAAEGHRLFDALRTLDDPEISFILAQCPDETGVGLAVANRLKRAAAFHVINARRTYVVGLTGPTGAGKSTVCTRFADAGAQIVDCDRLYHEMLASDEAMNADLRAAFPTAYRDDILDRKALGRIVFADPAALQTLNATVLPHVAARIERIINEADAEGTKLLVLDAPTLLESGADALCDLTICVTAPPQLRMYRIAMRDNLDDRYAQLRVEGGKDDDFYRGKCDETIVNDGELSQFCAQIDQIIHKIN